MTSSSTEKVNYWGGQHQSTINRHASRTASTCAAFLLPHLDKLGPGFRFLDLGCGPGSITTDLASRYPSASFLGIDSGSKAIAHAKELAEQRNVSNVRFIEGDIMALDGHVEWGSYDVVYCHQVLIHMQQPVVGLASMKRAAKANGGLVAARESFRGGLHYWPPVSGPVQWTTLAMDMIDRNGSSSTTGLQLITFALAAGFTRSQITHSVGANSVNIPEERIAHAEMVASSLESSDSETRRRLLEAGMADEEKLKRMARDFREWAQADDAWTCFTNGEIVCRNG